MGPWANVFMHKSAPQIEEIKIFQQALFEKSRFEVF